MTAFLPVGILLIVALCFCGLVYFATTHLGPDNPLPKKLSPYECGVTAEQNVRTPFEFRYYVIAVLFLLFDVEAAFFLPWALVYRESLGVDATLLVAFLVYSFFVVIGLVYIVRKGALLV